MNLIATVDKNWAIGKQGHLLVNIPEDIKLFRMETAGKAAIMGRKTYEQITDRTALIDRYNVVLTSDLSYKKDGVVVVHSVEEALEKVASYKSEDIYVIGGESVFEQFLPYCDVAHITSVDYKYAKTIGFYNRSDQFFCLLFVFFSSAQILTTFFDLGNLSKNSFISLYTRKSGRNRPLLNSHLLTTLL